MLFPEPDGPMIATISPLPTRDVDAVEGPHGGLPLAVDLASARASRARARPYPALCRRPASPRSSAGPLRRSEQVLEPLDRLDRRRDRRPRRAASWSERRSPSITAHSSRSVRLSPSVSTRATAVRRAPPGPRSARSAASPADAGRGPRGRRRSAGRPRRPPPSRRSRCGPPRAARAVNAGSLAFSLIWVFHRSATGTVRSAP